MRLISARLVAAQFNEDSLQIGSLVSRKPYRPLAMKFAVPLRFGHCVGRPWKAFGYHVAA
jgi:hypothetical protein